MSDSLSLRLCKVLCANGGSMELGQLGRALGLTSKKMARLLEAEEGRILVTRPQGSEQVCVYVSTLRMCADRNQECAGDCERLHLCRYYVLGGCTRSHCKFNHSIDQDHITRVLKLHHLAGLTITELRHLLLQNDPNLLPDVCIHYNRGEGPHGTCTYKTSCNKLHICQHFLQDDCMFGVKCKRSHNLAAEDTIQKLMKWGLAASIVPMILETYLNANAIKNGTKASPKTAIRSPAKDGRCPDPARLQKSADQQPIEEICLYFILNSCNFKERCVRDHYHLPYRWQVSKDGTWEDFSDMETIEQAYCDPNTRKAVLHVNFDTMTYKRSKIKRLSTPSSASKPPHFILTTDWRWYWRDEYNMWIEYGQETDDHKTSTITSRDIENVFMSDKKTNIQFKAGKQDYVLSLKEMVQRNTRYGTEREVCRRPKFLSAEDVRKMKIKKSDSSKANNDKSTPAHWDKGQAPEVGYKLVPLGQASEEYKTIETMFLRTLRFQIQSIERIQNPALWEVYQWQKEQMKKQNGGKEVDERQLFHGTSSKMVDAICQQNFDWRICGVHGTAYGKGSYFARDASYSHQYSSHEDRHQYVLFVARVLVGDFIRGSSSYLRPPAKPSSSSSFYDSCVDSERNPSIFVLFEKHQIYPEYVIRYTEQRQDLSGLMSVLGSGWL
ncbi:protein mono-ADP-ribosyltransferase PARP12-like isoform X2 [Pseudophryne corroboree]|uniref:protein mono-ADP-ribosyltransferase PARP12-like isoform X2 n=1 Tax=Pseudophryne corroboree TaxID=495146 RepID=UPI0030815ACB